MDGKKLNKSHTSIQIDLNQPVDAETYCEYIQMLNQNYETVSKLLKVAENLIHKYEQENKDLKRTNQILNNKLSDLNQQIDYLKQILFKDQEFKIEDVLTNLSKRDTNIQSKMNNLVQQLQKSQAKINKITRQKHEKIQKNLHNFFEFPKSKSKNISKQQELRREIRSLKWKLQQKDEQVLFMIKRNKMIQDSHSYKSSSKNFNKFVDQDRFYTCQTQLNKNFL